MLSLPVLEALDAIEDFRFNLSTSLRMFTVYSFDLEPGEWEARAQEIVDTLVAKKGL